MVRSKHTGRLTLPESVPEWERITQAFEHRLREDGATSDDVTGVAMGIAVRYWATAGRELGDLHEAIDYVWSLHDQKIREGGS